MRLWHGGAQECTHSARRSTAHSARPARRVPSQCEYMSANQQNASVQRAVGQSTSAHSYAFEVRTPAIPLSTPSNRSSCTSACNLLPASCFHSTSINLLAPLSCDSSGCRHAFLARRRLLLRHPARSPCARHMSLRTLNTHLS